MHRRGVTVKDSGELTVNLLDLVDELSDQAKRELAEMIAIDKGVMRVAMDAVAGQSPGMECAWWPGEEFSAELRQKLIPHMDGIALELIRALLTRIERADAQAKRWEGDSDALRRDWFTGRVRCEDCGEWVGKYHKAPERPDYPILMGPRVQDVEALLAAMEEVRDAG